MDNASYETINYLSELLGQVILANGPVLIEKSQWEAGLPEEAKGVMVEDTQEGYLVFLTDKEFVDDEDIDGNGDGVSPDVQVDDEPNANAERTDN
jgi:hypothetical protein